MVKRNLKDAYYKIRSEIINDYLDGVAQPETWSPTVIRDNEKADTLGFIVGDTNGDGKVDKSDGDVNKDGKVDKDDVDFYADRLLVRRETEKQRQLEYPLQQLPKARARYDRAMQRIDNIMSRGIGQTARENIGQETQVKDAFDQEARRQKQREAYEVMNQMKDFYNQLDENQRYMFDAYRTGASLKNVNETDQSYLDAQSLYGVVKKDPKIEGNTVIEQIKKFKKPDEVATYLGYLFAQEDEPMRFGMTRDKK